MRCATLLADGLRAAGFQSDRPAFLGVVPYLTRDAISATFSFIASLPESEVVFDYSEPIENYSSERRTNVAAIEARVATIGEPWLSHFDPTELSRELHARGFGELEDLGLGDIFVRFFGMPRGEAKGGPGPHIVRARRVARGFVPRQLRVYLRPRRLSLGYWTSMHFLPKIVGLVPIAAVRAIILPRRLTSVVRDAQNSY